MFDLEQRIMNKRRYGTSFWVSPFGVVIVHRSEGYFTLNEDESRSMNMFSPKRAS